MADALIACGLLAASRDRGTPMPKRLPLLPVAARYFVAQDLRLGMSVRLQNCNRRVIPAAHITLDAGLCNVCSSVR